MIYSSERTRNSAKSGKEWGKDYIPRSYTFNLRTYKNAGDKDASILIRNIEGEEGLLVARVAIRKQLTDGEHGKIWRHFMDRMRKAGYSLYFVREWDDDNRLLHYHLVVRPDDAPPNNINLHTDIRQSLPDYIRSHCEVYPRQDDISALMNPIGHSRYIHKAETMITDLLGNRVDANAQDRRLYPKETSLKKIGSHRTFWKKPKKVLWQEIVEENKAESDKSKQEQKELKQFQTNVDNHILTLATPEQHQKVEHLLTLTQEIQPRTILLNLVWSSLDDDTLEEIGKRYLPKQYPDIPDIAKDVLQAVAEYEGIPTERELLETGLFA